MVPSSRSGGDQAHVVLQTSPPEGRDDTAYGTDRVRGAAFVCLERQTGGQSLCTTVFNEHLCGFKLTAAGFSRGRLLWPRGTGAAVERGAAGMSGQHMHGPVLAPHANALLLSGRQVRYRLPASPLLPRTARTLSQRRPCGQNSWRIALIAQRGPGRSHACRRRQRQLRYRGPHDFLPMAHPAGSTLAGPQRSLFT